MEARGFEARLALQRKADEEVLSILHFRRRPAAGAAGAAGVAGAEGGGAAAPGPA